MPTAKHGIVYVEEAQAQKEVTINSGFDDIDALLPQTGAGSPEGVVTGAVGDLYRDSTNGYLYFKQTGSGNTGWRQIPDAGSTPTWVKVNFDYTDLAVAALTNDIELLSLAAGGVIHAVKIKHSASFTGGSIVSYTLSVGIAGNLTKYAPAFDVFQANGATVFQLSTTVGSENHNAAVSIRLAATAGGGNLDTATQGDVNVWVLVSFPV